MSDKPKITSYKTLKKLVNRLRSDLKDEAFVLLFAFNGTGKTRTSMAFKEKGKKVDNEKKNIERDTLYFNAFTEDLFVWENDLENEQEDDTERFLKINSDSNFFSGFKELALEDKIKSYLNRYVNFDFKIDYENWKISFSKEVKNPKYHLNNQEPEFIPKDFIKVSRGEETIFIWCVFLAICELVLDGQKSYEWVKYIYIDDPISSLDDNNAIAMACDLAKLLKKGKGKNNEYKVKAVISSHHSLFFNVMFNELKNQKSKRYFLHKNGTEDYTLQNTKDTPFFHHVAILHELKESSEKGKLNTHHFNALRSVLEKTATFFGYNDFGKCLKGTKDDDDTLYERALNLLSHGGYSIYEPVEMGADNKELFKEILNAFLEKYKFELPELIK